MTSNHQILEAEKKTRYKFKVWDEVYLNDGWLPPFKFTIARRFKHHGDNFYMLMPNKDWTEAQKSLHGTYQRHDYASKTPIFEGHLSLSFSK